MIGTSKRRSAEFFAWESQGRGYCLWPHPVPPEPPFRPLVHVPAGEGADEGRKPTYFSSLLRRISERLAPPARVAVRAEDESEEPPPPLARGELTEIQAHLPSGVKFDRDAYAGFFTALSVCVEPLTLEIIATVERITVQFVVCARDHDLVSRQLEAFFPDVSFVPVRGFLEEAWGELGSAHAVAVEFGLGKEFVIPLNSGRGEPFVGLVGALSDLRADEIAVFQVIFSPVVSPWHESILRSVTHADGSALFINAPELLPAAKEKTALPLYAVVVRLAARADDHARTWEIACNAAGALGAYGSVRGNELIPLHNDGYPQEAHEKDVLERQSRRSGMILNAEELAGFAHLPAGDVKSARLRRTTARTKSAPQSVRHEGGLRLGTNVHLGLETPVVLTHDQRSRHVHIVGASGTGKSTLLYNLLIQDIENGEGISLLDPHGDLVDRVLGSIPESRIQDVVLLDPSDEDSIVGFNILSAHSDWEKNMLAADLVAIFRRLSTSWGDQLNSVLHNALLAFLESDRGGTLLDVRRFLIEPTFRVEFLKTVRDPNVVYYWRKAFPMLTGNKSVGPIVTRLDTLLSPKPIRYMVAQKENRLDFGDIMDSGKIFLAKLSQGAVGKENSHLLGSLLVAKIQGEAMSRQRQSEESRRFHFLYADEFHEFLTPSLAECLSGVRKYRLGLVLPHQEMRQAERDGDVASALLNAYTRIVFRVNDRDSRSLESGFSAFQASDLQNLSTGQAVCRVERSDGDFNLAVDAPRYPHESAARERRRAVVAASRQTYGTPRAEIEDALLCAAEVEAVPVAAEREPKPIREVPPKPPEPVERAQPQPEPKPLPVLVAEKKSEPALPLTDLGKGGAQHKAIQGRIKEDAEKLGFRVSVEKEVLGGLGQIDLVLVRGELAIACEISVTGTIDYEVGNVSKCIKAGFRRVAVISTTEMKLRKLESAVLNSLGHGTAAFTSYHLPDAFMLWLRGAEAPKPEAQPEVRTRGGRVVKRTFTPISSEEAKAKEAEALSIMAEMMKAKRQ